MRSSRGSGRGCRRRMKKKLAQLARPFKPLTIPLVTRPQPKFVRANINVITHTERDLETDEAVLELYKRWCLHHEIHRTLEQMQLRFIYFKKRAISVLENNKKDNSCFCCLSRFSDKTDKEKKRRPLFRG